LAVELQPSRRALALIGRLEIEPRLVFIPPVTKKYFRKQKVPNIYKLHLELAKIAMLLFPPFPSMMLNRLGCLDYHGAQVRIACVSPVGVDAIIHRCLELKHGLELSCTEHGVNGRPDWEGVVAKIVMTIFEKSAEK
jgi:hypothetical protein